jgi:hypothetical protein
MRGSGGIILIVMVMCLCMIGLAVIGYFEYNRRFKKPAAGSPAAGSPGELIITEDGASMTEGYRIMPRREKYVQFPNVSSCGTEGPKDYCSAYDVSDTSGFAFVYDLSLKDSESPKYFECPGGGHDCWYIEKYDDEGTLIGVDNKNGESMLDRIADDIWGDKWDMENHPMVQEVKGGMEFKNGTLIATKKLQSTINAGDVITPIDFPTSLYFTALLIAMKLAGVEKPSKITLKIRNARDLFVQSKRPADVTTTVKSGDIPVETATPE